MLIDADLRFGRCQVHLAARTVWLDGARQPLPDAAFDMLALLLQRRPQVVSTGEVVRQVWQGTLVPDSLLAQTVMRLRAAIGDTGPQPRWLHSVHGVGYRLAAPEELAPVPHPGAPAATAWRAPRLGLLPCVPSAKAALPPGLALGLPTLLAESLTEARADSPSDGPAVPPGLTLVPATELQALQPPPAGRAHPLAALALQACGLDHVLHLGWRPDGLTAVLGWQLRSAAGPGPGGELRGDDALSLAGELAALVAQALMPAKATPIPRRPTQTADPFITQAFARGVTLHQQRRWQAAGLAFDLVRQAHPDALAPRLWQLRGVVAQALHGAPDQARALADKAGHLQDHRTQAEALVLWQQALATAPSESEREEGTAHAAQGLGLLESHRHEPWAVTLRIEAGLCAATCGHWTQARRWLQQAVGDSRTAALPLWLGRALQGLARIELSLGDGTAALRHLQEALRMQRGGCDAASRTRTLALLALARLGEGEVSSASALADEALALTERQPAAERPAETLSALALVHVEQAGAEGSDRLDRIMAAFGPPDQDLPATRTHRLAVQACAALSRGDGPAARRWLSVAVACRGDAASQGLIVPWVSLLSRLALVAGEHGEALALVPAQAGWLGLPQGPITRGLRLHAEAAAAWQGGDASLALAKLEQLIAMQTGGRLQGCARLDAAWLQLEQGRPDLASKHLQAAGAWPTEHAAGLAARARLHHAQGQAAAALHLHRLALRQFQGQPPPAHQALLQTYLAGTSPRADGAVAIPVLPVLLSDSWLPAPPATMSR